jgi:hypothetical protein
MTSAHMLRLDLDGLSVSSFEPSPVLANAVTRGAMDTGTDSCRGSWCPPRTITTDTGTI